MLNDVPDGKINDGTVTLRDAIDLAPAGETINFASSVTGTMLLNDTLGEMKITRNLTIIGPGPDLLTIDATSCDPTPNSVLNDIKSDDGDGCRIFNVTGANVAISGITFTGGDAGGVGDDGKGGAIRTTGNLSITNCAIIDNHAFIAGDSSGGGIFCAGALTINNSIVSGNQAPKAGGIYAGSVTLTNNSSVAGNMTYGDGGGIFASGDVTINSSRVVGNEIWPIVSIPQKGGGVFAAGNVTITNGSLIHNNSSRFGGGVFAAGNASVIDSQISQNRASISGGGGTADGGAFTVVNSTISGNAAGDDGGGLSGRTVLVSFSTISDNTARRGGGIGSTVAGGGVTVNSSTISRNSASATNTDNLGGGVYSRYALNISHSTITGNSVGALPAKPGDPTRTGDGGGAASKFGPMTIRNSIVAGNLDVKDGSHPDLQPATTLTVEFSIIGDNSGTGLPAGNPAAGGNKIGTPALPINPLLAPLANYGGSTLTHALVPGSPAIDMGDPGFAPPPGTDQRGNGFPRVHNGRVDIGALREPTTRTPDSHSCRYARGRI